jgi:hypothetical protein
MIFFSRCISGIFPCIFSLQVGSVLNTFQLEGDY